MGALTGIRVLDLSRILAGPLCTQILGDLGADVVKIEKPGEGDDTRKWGPPFLKDADGNDTSESAYYLSVNRNKRSLALDIATPEGQRLIHALLGKADVLIQNFKVGGLEKYGLGYEQLRERYPGLVYCAITGFGRNGPLAGEPGYDFLAQAMGGLMAATGTAEGEPMKAGVALSDVMTGLYAAIGILAALHRRGETGEGQLVDVSLLDSTVAGMVNLAQYYLTSGKIAPRLGNAHSTIVPYQVFATADGHVILAVGNDGQFRRFCAFIGRADWAADEKYATNPARVRNRAELVPMIEAVVKTQPTAYWVENMRDCDVPAGPVNTMDQVFAMEQVAARGMKVPLAHPLSPEPLHVVGSPLKLSATPVEYRSAPPVNGQHTEEILQDWLGIDAAAAG
jgi:crotonobetainyl-CoA:carnitine CoA-transferase CaiB-like acyl-CoA transferase